MPMTKMLLEIKSTCWGLLEIGDPQVTMAFNTKVHDLKCFGLPAFFESSIAVTSE